jgi:hypothetical protein
MDGTFLHLVDDTDLGHYPPASRARVSFKGFELRRGTELGASMLGARHGATDDLAANQLDAFIGARQQVVDGLSLGRFHRDFGEDNGPSSKKPLPRNP